MENECKITPPPTGQVEVGRGSSQPPRHNLGGLFAEMQKFRYLLWLPLSPTLCKTAGEFGSFSINPPPLLSVCDLYRQACLLTRALTLYQLRRVLFFLCYSPA